MLNLLNTLTDLKELKNIAKKLSDTVSIGDIYLLSGELGSGKTTFARFFINSIFDNNSIKKPESIKSPSFPLMINYSIKNFHERSAFESGTSREFNHRGCDRCRGIL